MAGIQSAYMKKQFEQDPAELVRCVIQNNPYQVVLNMKLFAGQAANAEDTEEVFDTFAAVMQANPSIADDLAMKILSVPIAENNLTDVGKDFVLDEIINNQQKSAWLPDTGLTAEEINYIQNSSTSNTANSSASSFNWGEVIGGSLPGILAAFGITPQQNSNAAPTTNQSSGTNWMMIAIVVVIIALMAFLIYRASKA